MRNFGAQPSYRPLLGAVEELGELTHAHLKGEQGIRHTPEAITAKKKDALADIIIYLCDYASREGLDLHEALNDAWAEVRLRDWTKKRSNEEALNAPQA